MKYFEIRDRATCIPVLVVRLEVGFAPNVKIRRMLANTGYGTTPEDYIILIKLADGSACKNPHHWNSDTMRQAHEYINQNYDELQNGQVIDLRFVRGETDEPCGSDFE